MKKESFIKSVSKIIKILESSDKLIFPNNSLFEMSKNKIFTPFGDVLPLLLKYRSPLKNDLIDTQLLEKMIQLLIDKQALIRLNHIGFCYAVIDQEKERKRLALLTKKTNFHLYQEKSNDCSLWLFVGDTKNWQDPMLEFLPVASNTKDRWMIHYWLPHIHIDLDTTLTEVEIELMIDKVFGDKIEPYRSVVIDKVTYLVRAYVGTIDGINIHLDFATKRRRVKYMREELLKKLV
ncbi:hypothetical protein A2334_03380 [Candidatus Roizmanbacteria bacterium RIFOXYB2_FULL_38_10]|uniref:Uncharacterized protein n=1 Tax=Candidatus Roizmanbacteria bacterium RIFOXYD1_FULL_38_12 TaxID=1802093 RepID=A0A1F7L192_9BACT|nr:MAG: hypothetical protein A3K47_03465 [Candidatus Roizmanbacteria bacterium RIFOXYA2_FULL_38_14]OGK63821.1 MAG: hypothetical protein A3K27_03465 [Candidatus Roizmanbacteria bacterium RIFOXYA1_FULL_37_12]OGK65667.1 MAG: hypothetical protein A3K38_03465 [Candidatus Roizmanbacteria bacterium RIFOXYB1_FULL_40_23]OGK67445.1 MAG: hypothetical protein A2334_03380 [Candidatus Roizmanbacteria bacterium RIFOXYB2_FULL_38_10]OGK70072.1 MAG: hypothetical protein A3K21_03470 [Candidatus Roizmanbacteria ba